MITAEQVKALRDRTGVSIGACKKALEEAQGDAEKAIMILRKKGSDIAAKKSDRMLAAGTIAAYIHAGGTVGAMVHLASETDFVSSNAAFKELAYTIAMHVAAANPAFLSVDTVPEDIRARAHALFAHEVAASDKPQAIKDKMLAGKLDAYFKEQALLSQQYIKNSDITVQGLIEESVQKFGEKIAVIDFKRFSVR